MSLDVLSTLHFQGQTVRMIDKSGEPWWVAADVCRSLGLDNATRACERIDEDDLSLAQVIDSIGRSQKVNVINEAGLYTLILRSEKPEAKAFKRWITHDVLPTLRKTGSYVAALPEADAPSPARLIAKLETVFDDYAAGRIDHQKAAMLAKMGGQCLRALKAPPAPKPLALGNSRLNAAAKQRAIRQELLAHADLSNRAIAAKVGVDDQTVGKVRKIMHTRGELLYGMAGSQYRMGRDGKRYPRKTPAIPEGPVAP